MATVQERLKALASTTEEVGGSGGLSSDELERNKSAVTDFSMVTFSLAGKDYAIDIMKVKERAKAGHFTYVPNSLPFVLGVYNLRGDIIPVIDLRLFFNIEVPPREDDKLENMLIVVVGEQTFGVVVDEIDRVVGIQKSSVQPPHPLFGDINIKYIYGVVEAEQHLYILLDIDKIFGIRTPEEEQEFQQAVRSQIAAAAMQEAAAKVSVNVQSSGNNTPAQAVADDSVSEEDLKFIADSLKSQKRFLVSPITSGWVKQRYLEWKKTRGADKTQIQNESDADEFLKPFYSRHNGEWWNQSSADGLAKALPDNSAKNMVVWNPGCGKGYESYTLACILKKRYTNARIRIYAHDIDLLNVSNAPMLTLNSEVAKGWYSSYVASTVNGDVTFDKEIKDMIMFEYHDCANANTLPDIDIIVARDVLAFQPENSLKVLLDEFKEKIKGNGVIIVGDNEDISSFGFKKKKIGDFVVYSK